MYKNSVPSTYKTRPVSITQPNGIGHTKSTIKDHKKKRGVPCGAVNVSGAVRGTADYAGK